MGINSLRTYLRELRVARGISQGKLASEIGLARRTFISWEMGRTDEIKTGPLVRAVSFLDASFDDVKYLIESDASEEDAKILARKRLYDSAAGVQNTANTELEEVLEIVLRLKNNKESLSQLVEYARKLLQNKD